jgi:hypothetical protein
MTIMGVINRQFDRVSDKIFECPKVQQMTQSKVGRAALYALAGLTIAGGVALAAAAFVAERIAVSAFPVVKVALLIGGFSAGLLLGASMTYPDRETSEFLRRLSENIFSVMCLPVVPGIALAKSGLDAIQRVRATPVQSTEVPA